MRLWLRLLITLVVLVGTVTSTWCYLNREDVTQHWACYRVGKAKTFDEARALIAGLENGPNHEAGLGKLVNGWGIGNQQFDLYLAQYVCHPGSSERLRKSFSLGFGWHQDRLPRWAHYWSWRTNLPPDEEIASIISYLDVLLRAESKTITWREVLDLQAVFHLTGQPDLAKRLSPETWRNRYRTWRERTPAELAHVPRPETPLPDWEGPAPNTDRLAPDQR